MPKKSEDSLSRLETVVAELAEAQNRTEQRLNELAEAQKRTEEEIRKLTGSLKRTREVKWTPYNRQDKRFH